ncbi:hypothetical protein GQ44DRAFT_631386 [Phaeosphaeriaceae sp. PMI808]|nr:hypothetical protein GQ44DRAFT_631386 [Phaeosphaeriaceae sp. PMI808]
MEIPHPRRILTLGSSESGVLKLLNDLTGSAPEPTSGSVAGLAHEWFLETKYYTATIPIWVDEIPNLEEWRTAFTGPEAREVIVALGAWIYCFRKPVTQNELTTIKDTMKAVAEAIKGAEIYDHICLAVAMPQSTTPFLDMSSEEWEDICKPSDFEYIDFEKTGKNDFGEKVGVQRLREALEACEWESVEELAFGGDDDGEEFGDFTAEEVEMNVELFGMKGALHDDDLGGETGEESGKPKDEENEAKIVEETQEMMRKLMAVREMGEGMEETERKRFAAKAFKDIMKDL